MSKKLQPALDWFGSKNWKPFPFQQKAWKAYLDGKNGLLNAPTGSGKTYAMLLGVLLQERLLQENGKPSTGLQLIWITPIRALAEEIRISSQRALEGMGIDWEVGVRTGDTKTAERARQSKKMPQILITTPESLHLLLAQKGYPQRLKKLKAFVADEWHELIGSKRGVQIELGLSKLKTICPQMRIWAISATIGNMEEALQVFLGNWYTERPYEMVKSKIRKKIEVESILPDEVENMPWSGHLGIKLLDKVIPIINKSRSTLIFTNTRAQTEIWYQRLLAASPDLAGIMAMHHGSISKELRKWVEQSLHDEKLKAVVCTSSLDLGVDFRPVETIIQIGGPKGVARFLQRAGRSGHQPGATSKIYFVPTHSLELVEAAALREAIKSEKLESRTPYIRSFDVLAQYMVTLAVSEGFKPDELLQEVKTTFCYESISDHEWGWLLNFITTGGESLQAYDEFKKVVIEDGLFKVISRRTATMHRLSMGTIVSDQMMTVKYVGGKRLGTVEEWFISSMRPGDIFWFAGRNLELIRVKDMSVQVRNANTQKGKIPSWQGGRMPLSAQLADVLRQKMEEALSGTSKDIEIQTIMPLLDLQEKRSAIPKKDEFLIECFHTKEGHHLVLYPMEGRFVHEAIASLLAYRMSLLKPISFSLAFSDYGLEMLSDQQIPVQEMIDNNLLTSEHLKDDLQAALNTSEMTRRRFRDIANISGLVFQGYPGKSKKNSHLQASASLFFEVFRDYDPGNLLLKQAYEEALEFQLEEVRLRKALNRISQQKWVVTFPDKPTPFSFPIMVDRLRERFIGESLAERVKKMQVMYS